MDSELSKQVIENLLEQIDSLKEQVAAAASAAEQGETAVDTRGLQHVRDSSWAPVGGSKVPFDPVGPQCFGTVGVLVKRPDPLITDDCFSFEERPVPDTIDDDKILVKTTYLSMDPTHQLWMQEIPQYMPAVGLGTVMRCLALATVVKSKSEKFPVGTAVSLVGGVAEYTVVSEAELSPVVPGVPMEYNLGPFSLIQGHTAWVGYKYCELKKGDTMVVSGAAGAVGSIAAQLGKMAGAKVIGIAGGPKKCGYVTDTLGLDGCVDYKAESVDDGIKRLCPDGVDAFFDNVGGSTLEQVVKNFNCFGRIAMCGSISSYEGKMGENATGFKNYEMILMRRITMQGFVVVDHLASVGDAFGEIGAGLASGAIKWKGDVREGGVKDYVKTVNLLFNGGNDGKLMIKLPA
jgi:NADPH-dependent curcumin reductase CurA